MSTKQSLLSRALIAPDLFFYLLNKYKNKAAPIDPTDIDAIKQELEAFWQNANNTLVAVMNTNKNNYHMNIGINIAIVSLGMILLIVSIIEGIIKGVDALTAINAGIGVTSFVTIFLVNPQKAIRQSNDDIAQMEIIFIGWFNETLTAFYRLVSNGFTNSEIELFQAALSKYTNEAVTLIETNIGTG
jgi:hypothetical protein